MQFISKPLYRQDITYEFNSKLTAWVTWSLSKDLNRLHNAYISYFKLNIDTQFLNKYLYRQSISYEFHFKLIVSTTDFLSKDLNGLHQAYVSGFELRTYTCSS